MYRKKLVSKLEKLYGTNKDKRHQSELVAIYNIIIEDIGNNFSSNRNGIFINMNILSDNSIMKIENFIDNKEQSSILSTTQSETVSSNIWECKDDTECGAKLSNQEKHIIKRIRNKN